MTEPRIATPDYSLIPMQHTENIGAMVLRGKILQTPVKIDLSKDQLLQSELMEL